MTVLSSKEIERLAKLASAKNWKQPRPDDYFGIEVWAAYWKAMEEYGNNPELGRPVVPHRSGR